jgi:hypothetical protein
MLVQFFRPIDQKCCDKNSAEGISSVPDLCSFDTVGSNSITQRSLDGLAFERCGHYAARVWFHDDTYLCDAKIGGGITLPFGDLLVANVSTSTGSIINSKAAETARYSQP